jgi:type VI secretion system secreted protein VgrG
METEFQNVRLESQAISEKEVELRQFSGREVISRLFDYQLYIVCTDPAGIDVQALIDNEASLVFEKGQPPEEVRRIHGMIASVKDCYEAEWGFSAYRVQFVPRAWRLGLHETLEIYLEQNVPEIIETVLKNAGLSTQDFELRLRGDYPVREFVVQYKETDLAFISRIAEHMGISFFFDHSSGKDVLIFSDENSGFGAIEGGGKAKYNVGGLQSGVYKMESETKVIPSKYVVRDYNYRTPDVEVLGESAIAEGQGGEIVEYGPHCKTQEDAALIAKVRSEEVGAGRRVLRGESNEMTFSGGTTFKLEEPPRGEDLELLLVEVESSAIQTVFDRSDGTERTYTNVFRGIPAATTYRPPRITPKPRIHGVVTGIVEPSDQHQYAEIDDEGRYLVRFLFDTAKIGERKASKPVRMAQPHSGQGYGMHFPLRPGVEVLLTCVNGDPDRPIISGTVPNPMTASPVLSENLKKNVIRTGGGNEIDIDDTEGLERIKLSTPHMSTVFQMGSPNAPEQGLAFFTSGAATNVATAGKGTFSSVGTVIDTVRAFRKSPDIVTLSEPATKEKMVLMGLAIGDALVGLVDSTFSTVKSFFEIKGKVLEEEKKAAQEKADEEKKKADQEAAEAESERAEADEKEREVQGEKDRAESKLPDDKKQLMGELEAAEKEVEEKTAEIASLESDMESATKIMEEAEARKDAAAAALADLELQQTAIEGGEIPLSPAEKTTKLAEIEAKKQELEQEVAREDELAKTQEGILEDKEKTLNGDPDALPPTSGATGELEEKKAAQEAKMEEIDKEAGTNLKETNEEAEDAKEEAETAEEEQATAQASADSAQAEADLADQRCKDHEKDMKEGPDAVFKWEKRIKQVYDAGKSIVSKIYGLWNWLKKTESGVSQDVQWAKARLNTTKIFPRTCKSASKVFGSGIKLMSPKKPHKCLHVVGSKHNAVLYGEEKAFMWGETAVLMGRSGPKKLGPAAKGNAFVIAQKLAVVESDDKAEFKGKNKSLISGKEIDAESEKFMKLASKKHNIKLSAKKKTILYSGDEISLACGQSKITLKKDGTITIKGMKLTLDGKTKVEVKSSAQLMLDGKAKTEIKGGAQMKLQSTGQLGIEGLMLDMKASTMAKLEGSAMTKIGGGVTMIG